MKENEKIFKWYSATLRFHEAPQRHEELLRRFGAKHCHDHLKGEVKPTKTKRFYPNNIFTMRAPLPRHWGMGKHIAWIAEQARPHRAYIRRLLRAGVEIDLFCGYQSNCTWCGFNLDTQCLEFFVRLEIPMTVSVIIT